VASPPDPGPMRLEALLRGDEPPRGAEERDMLALAAAFAASEPALPEALDARIEAALRGAGAGRPERRTRWASRAGAKRRWLAPALAAAGALAVALPLWYSVRSAGPAAGWYPSSELVPRPGVTSPPAQVFSAASPASGQYVLTGGFRLRLRAGPGRSFAQVRTLPDGAPVRVVCTGRGATVLGPFGASDLWDRLAGGGYASDAFVYTGSAGPVAPPCPR
jgi:hypothetical protein